MENTSDILKRVRILEIKTRGLSNDLFAGRYHSAFKGRGMAFREVRGYEVGDDVRDIDWNVTARHQSPYVKVYEEERELTMMLLVDVSASRVFGTTGQTKRSLMAEIAAVLAFSASKNNDKVGCLLFSDRVEKFIPPKKGRAHILMIIRELLSFTPKSDATDISQGLRYLTNVLTKRCTAFVLSDFIDMDGERAAFEDALKIASGKHDMVAIRVFDRREAQMPPVGVVEFRDAESGRLIWVDTTSRRTRDDYAAQWRRRSHAIESALRRCRVDSAEVATGEDYVDALIKLFKRR